MSAYSTDVTFDIREIPFSRRGSWLNLSPVTGLHQISDEVHLVSHRVAMHPIFAIVPASEGQWVGSPAVLAFEAAGRAIVECAFESGSVVRVRGRGRCALRVADNTLTPFTGAYFFVDPQGCAISTVYETGSRYHVSALAGTWEVVGAQALGEAQRGLQMDGEWELRIEELAPESNREPVTDDFDAVVESARSVFGTYVETIAGWRSTQTPAAELAAYVLWSATVAPAGFVTRESVLMSKHWMDSVWSWDHCFNALALFGGLPAHGWDQLLVPFDHQDLDGQIPDSVTHSRVLRNFVKPPIHGWTVDRLAERGQFDDEQTTEAYRVLSRATKWWCMHRTVAEHRTPYYEHGNDSGWDNSTIFDAARVVETSDLAAFLVLQMRTLASLAQRLGRADERDAWSHTAAGLQQRMIDRFWDGTRFIARDAITDAPIESRSLLSTMAIVLGEHLPADIVAAVTVQIKENLTAFGLATEPVDSVEYDSDGYWRGPIWAPSTLLIENGLRRAGQIELADTIADRFLTLCDHHGFAENFDAMTGAGLRDRAYSWTAATYLILAQQQSAHGAETPVD